MRKLYLPESEAELLVIKSLLDGERIRYFVHNDYFGSLEIGPKIDLYNAKTVMVGEDQYDRAMQVLGSFAATKKSGKVYKSSYSLTDRIRMAIETLLFMWFMPGRMRKKIKKETG